MYVISQTGEHGVVYKGILSRTGSTVTERVAVKTIGCKYKAVE